MVRNGVIAMSKAAAAANKAGFHMNADLTSLNNNLFNQGMLSMNSQGLFGGNTVQSN